MIGCHTRGTGAFKFRTFDRLLQTTLLLAQVLRWYKLSRPFNASMGASDSKQWSEIPPETPQAVNKRLTRLQIPDPRSPFPEAHRTPIHLESYDESPQNLELNIADPRSPGFCLQRTPITVTVARKSLKPTANDGGKEANSEKDEAQSVKEESKEPTSPNVAQINKLLGEIAMSPVSPGAPLSKKDTARLLKKTTSPSDFKRKRRLSSRRNSLPQQLFSDKVAPVLRSPLVPRNSVDMTEAVKKGNKLSFRAQKTKRPSSQEGLYHGKENAQFIM